MIAEAVCLGITETFACVPWLPSVNSEVRKSAIIVEYLCVIVMVCVFSVFGSIASYGGLLFLVLVCILDSASIATWLQTRITVFLYPSKGEAGFECLKGPDLLKYLLRQPSGRVRSAKATIV